MSYTSRYEPESLEDLVNLPSQIQARIVKKIDWLAENFDAINPFRTNRRFSWVLQTQSG
jgi:mRNA interferase RelE/StbE